jgi:hypothetical protein
MNMLRHDCIAREDAQTADFEEELAEEARKSYLAGAR